MIKKHYWILLSVFLSLTAYFLISSQMPDITLAAPSAVPSRTVADKIEHNIPKINVTVPEWQIPIKTNFSANRANPMASPVSAEILDADLNENISEHFLSKGASPIDCDLLKITSGYGGRTHPITGEYDYHTGVDIAVNGTSASKSICSVLPGTVTSVGLNNKGYGNAVTIEHSGFETFYAHLNDVSVAVNDTVRSGQEIGIVGSTGLSTGPHLHFEIIVDGKHVDPLPYLNLILPEISSVETSNMEPKQEKIKPLTIDSIISNIKAIESEIEGIKEKKPKGATPDPPKEQKQIADRGGRGYSINLLSCSKLTKEQINSLTNNTPLFGLGDAYIKAEKETGVNALFLLAMSIHESDWGKSRFAVERNNIFGFQAYAENSDAAKYFNSKRECIMETAQYLKRNYLTPSGKYYKGTSVKDVNFYYATDTYWHEAVERIMNILMRSLS